MKLCGAAITILFVFGMTSGFAAPIERAADSAECKGIIARLLEATYASFDRYSPSGENVFFRSPTKCADLYESSAYRHFPYVGCGRRSAERVVRATREDRQSGNGSRFEKAAISIPSVPQLGTEGQNGTSGHRNSQRENRVSGFHA
jgi:hypothetical protein